MDILFCFAVKPSVPHRHGDLAMETPGASCSLERMSELRVR